MRINNSRNTRNRRSVMGAANLNGVKILVRSKAFVDVAEDDYEQGEVGGYINSWDFDVRGEYTSIQQLINAIAEESYVFSKNLDDYSFYDGTLHTSAMVNNDNMEPGEYEYEAWKNGEETLYVADMRLNLEVGSVHEMTDDEAKMFGIKDIG